MILRSGDAGGRFNKRIVLFLNHCLKYIDRCSGSLSCVSNHSLLDEPKVFSMSSDKDSSINLIYAGSLILPEYITNRPRASPEMQPDMLT